MMFNRPMLYLIDGHAVAYRQYFGLPVAGFSTKSGEPTNAVFGFTRVLLDLIQKTRPKYLAVALDMGLSGRDTNYPDYKGTRERMPHDLRIQMSRIQQVLQAFNIPLLAVEGYEADDVIGTVVTQIASADVEVRIVTGDRDLCQLLNETVTVQFPGSKGQPDEIYDIDRFVQKHGIRPDQLIDMKALMGDSSDNIPGVRGIGEKTATQLLQQYDGLDAIYAHLDEIKGATQKKLIEGRDMAYLSRQLATIQRDVPVTLEMDACLAQDYNPDAVLDLFRELEFRTFIDRLKPEVTLTTLNMFEETAFEADSPTASPQIAEVVNTVIVRDTAALGSLVATLNQASAITWDVETTGIDQMQADLVGIALSIDGETGYYIPVGHESGTQLPLQQVLDALRAPLTNPDIPKYAHNAAYDMVMMSRYGINVTPVTFDTMIGEWLRDPASRFLGLKNLAMHELGVYMTPISDLIGTGKKQKQMSQLPIDQVAPYAAADAAITHRLTTPIRHDLDKSGLTSLCETLEMPIVPVIVEMEQVGVALDAGYLSALSARLADQLAALEAEIHGLSGGYGAFNINSPKQLNDVLFGKLGLPVAGLKKTTHGYSTDVVALEKLAADTHHPILRNILEHRELSKLKGTYVDALPELINPHTGRVHTSYNQTGTSTGRLSSSNPNLQNIPIRTELGREVRRAFIAPQGFILLAVDYSQIELRVLAHISRDQTLLEAFADNQDIHAATAAAVYGIPVDKVTYEQRSFAKRVNFGLIYGMGAFRLSRDSDLTLAEAGSFIQTYFERLPGVRQYIEQTKRRAARDGFLTTLFGRKRLFPALKNAAGRHASHQIIQAEERAAINMPIQGTASDIMKRAMIDLHHALTHSQLAAKMMLQVHDELVLEVPESELDDTRALVVRVMESAYPLNAPLKANAQVGTNWRDMK